MEISSKFDLCMKFVNYSISAVCQPPNVVSKSSFSCSYIGHYSVNGNHMGTVDLLVKKHLNMAFQSWEDV